MPQIRRFSTQRNLIAQLHPVLHAVSPPYLTESSYTYKLVDMAPTVDLTVPGYEDDDPLDPEPQTEPLSNPPLNHKLLNYQYDSLEDLVSDLHDWGAQARFGIKKARVANAVKGFGYTRVDFTCLKDKIRPTEAPAGRASSTTKNNCPWGATAKALASNGRRWTLEIRSGYETYNYPPAEGREDIATLRRFKLEHVAVIALHVNHPAVTNRQLAETLRTQFPGILFTKKQLKNARQRLRKASEDGYTPFQATMKLLIERDIPHKVLWSASDSNKPEGLV